MQFTCLYCNRWYNHSESRASNVYNYCCRQCELEAIKAENNLRNAEIISMGSEKAKAAAKKREEDRENKARSRMTSVANAIRAENKRLAEERKRAQEEWERGAAERDRQNKIWAERRRQEEEQRKRYWEEKRKNDAIVSTTNRRIAYLVSLVYPLCITAFCAFKGHSFRTFYKTGWGVISVIVLVLCLGCTFLGFSAEIQDKVDCVLEDEVWKYLKGAFSKFKRNFLEGLFYLIITLIGIAFMAALIGFVGWWIYAILGWADEDYNTPVVLGFFYVLILDFILRKLSYQKKIHLMIAKILKIANIIIPAIIMLVNWVIIPNYSRIDAKLKARENNKKVEQVDKPIEQVMNEND